MRAEQQLAETMPSDTSRFPFSGETPTFPAKPLRFTIAQMFLFLHLALVFRMASLTGTPWQYILTAASTLGSFDGGIVQKLRQCTITALSLHYQQMMIAQDLEGIRRRSNGKE